MKIAVAGGAGFLGRALTARLMERGHTVTVLSRKPRPAPAQHDVIVWNPYKPAGLELVLSGFDVVVNLSGAPIEGRWTDAYKELIVRSRVQSTAAIGEAMAKSGRRPRLFVNASAVGYYGNRGDEDVDESSAPGQGFLAETAVRWETEARKAESLGVPVALLRTGIVLGKNGGALPVMAMPFRFFAGGPLGNGRQWMPWIHLDDWTDIAVNVIESGWTGPVNLTAPKPVRNRDFARILGRVLRRPSFWPVPGFALRALIGPAANELILSGQRALPKKAIERGYAFRYPELEAALREALS